MDNDLQGFFTSYGYKGRTHDGQWMLFATQAEYEEYMKESNSHPCENIRTFHTV